jgi:hypothetical protein
MRERYLLEYDKLKKYSFGLDYNNSIIENLDFLSNIKIDSYDTQKEIDNGERKAFIQQIYLYKEYNNSDKQSIYDLVYKYYPFYDNIRVYGIVNKWY